MDAKARFPARGEKGLARQFAGFASRLRWHCHFIQKFESEDRIEFENVNRAFDAVPKNHNPAQYRAWETGHTSYPMVDACMRCLTQTGYINFRMRAMLTSFLTHHLFQDWKEGGLHLACGTNAVRRYDPVKQSHDHDPEGVFIRQWIPELANCPRAYIHEPWTMPPLEQDLYHFHVGVDYPAPIIDIALTAREAQTRLRSPRHTEVGKAEIERILQQHSVPKPSGAKPVRHFRLIPQNESTVPKATLPLPP